MQKTDFPFFRNNKDLIYLDNAATTQKPQEVIDTITEFYANFNAPVHRGIYSLAERATEAYEQARQTLAKFIGAHEDEIVFTKGTTEGINFVASSWAEKQLKPGDEILITLLEHHSNILPWLRLEQTKGIQLKYVPITAEGDLDYEAYLALLTSRTKLVACTHTSNALGTAVDLPFIIQHAHQMGAYVLIDAAQAVGRKLIHAPTLNADFIVFSGHKMLGPTGIGVLYIARQVQEYVGPYQEGGGMVYSVDLHSASWRKPPLCYEAGTPPIAQALGLAAAANYIERNIEAEALKAHEASLCSLLIEQLRTMPSVKILGPVDQLMNSGHMVTFASSRHHPHDIAAYLDKYLICVRAGNHCAQPLHKALGTSGTVRVSFYAYSTSDDVVQFIDHLTQMQKIL